MRPRLHHILCLTLAPQERLDYISTSDTTHGAAVLRYLDEQRLSLASWEPSQVLRKSLAIWEADFAGKCENPVFVELAGRPETETRETRIDSGIKSGKPTEVPLWLDVQARCRKCRPCLRARRALWASRAVAELRRAPRTWFVTLTCSPREHYEMLEHARKRAAQRGRDFDALSSHERFLMRAAIIGRNLTLFLKRLRKNTKGTMRCYWTIEPHKSGLPHLHGFIHDLSLEYPIKEKAIKSAWPYGFTKVKLVEDSADASSKSAWYVSKYLAKEMSTRVRASLHYGEGIEWRNEGPSTPSLPSSNPAGSGCVSNRPPTPQPVWVMGANKGEVNELSCSVPISSGA